MNPLSLSNMSPRDIPTGMIERAQERQHARQVRELKRATAWLALFLSILAAVVLSRHLNP